MFCLELRDLLKLGAEIGISVLRKIEYDLEYVNHFGFKYDLKILIETIRVVLGKKDSEITEAGISQELNVLRENPKNRKVKAK